MRTLTYTGIFAAVEVPLPAGGTVRAVRGEPVELPDDLADELIGRDEWVGPNTKAARKAAKEPAITHEPPSDSRGITNDDEEA